VTLNETQREIVADLSGMAPAQAVTEMAAQDRQLIEKTAPAVVGIIQGSGHSAEEATEAVGFAWHSLRVGKDAVPLLAPLTLNMVQVRADSLGKVDVKSDPPMAAIIVDDTPRDEDTNREIWAVVGRRQVRVERAGLRAEATCLVAKNSVRTFTAVLSAAGSKAECK
jgi:hypothetical protein